MRSRNDRSLEPINYLDVLFGRHKIQIALSAGVVILQRAGLGRHYHLQTLGQEITTVPLAQRVKRLRVWLEAAGIDNPNALTLADLLLVIKTARELNAPRGLLAWNLLPDRAASEARPTDYPGRQLARIVDLLARHYSWSLDEILNLAPEVALAHAQECVLADRRRREWEHYLSELAWEYDRGSQKSRYRPLPPLAWETLPAGRKYKPVPQTVKDRYFPKGIIIDLTKRGNDVSAG